MKYQLYSEIVNKIHLNCFKIVLMYKKNTWIGTKKNYPRKKSLNFCLSIYATKKFS